MTRPNVPFLYGRVVDPSELIFFYLSELIYADDEGVLRIFIFE